MDLVHFTGKKDLPSLTLVLGGAASGKSWVAEKLIESSGLSPLYLATSRIWDDETQKRVDVHKSRRDARWTTIDAPVDVATPLRQAAADQAVLLDCATMWLTNLMMDEQDIPAAQHGLFDAARATPAPVVIVSNEVGQGIVPDNAMAREFREVQGRFNIALAEVSDAVVHVVAGLPVTLKGAL